MALQDRAAFAGQVHGDIFLSIHHDSAQAIYLERSEYDGKPAYKTREPLSGYSVFISMTNPLHDRSRKLAQLIGESLFELGRPPSYHHAEKIPGEGREPLDASLGIYRFDDLVVLKKATIPAVLIELGVIVDEADEHYVSNAGNQRKMQEAITSALKHYFLDAVRLTIPAESPG